MIYMASTSIETQKTAQEIMILLGKNKAKYIQTEYKDNEIIGIDFIIEYNDKKIPFRLPIRWEPVLEKMKEDKNTPKHLCNPEQARRVAWRQILRWMQSQFALIQIGMVDVKEVFMPYILIDNDTTYYEKILLKHFAQIEYNPQKHE